MDSPAPTRTYKFDDLFTSLLRTKLIQRKTPNLPFELRSVELMLLIVVISILCIMTVLLSAIHSFERENLSDFCGYGATVSSILFIMIRAMALFIHRDVLKRLLTRLDRLFPISSKNQLRYNVHKHVNPIVVRYRILSSILSYSFLAVVVMPPLKWAFFSIVQGRKYSLTYPLMDWFPMDDIVSFVSVYCIHTIWIAGGILTFFHEDLVFSISVTQMCMHYQFLCESLTQLDGRKELESFRKLRKLIQLQNALTLIQEDFDTIFSLSTFFTFIVLKISICMFMVALVDGSSIDLMIKVRFTISIFLLMVPVYQRCSLGTIVQEDREKLMSSSYDSNWYEGSPRYRKILVTLMIRANIPTKLQASPLNIIGVEYFKELALQTYEFLMFLINFTN